MAMFWDRLDKPPGKGEGPDWQDRQGQSRCQWTHNCRPEWTGNCFVLHALHCGRECKLPFLGENRALGPPPQGEGTGVLPTVPGPKPKGRTRPSPTHGVAPPPPPRILRGSYLADGTTVVQPSSATAIAVALETDHQVPTPPTPLHVTVYSPSGLVSHPGGLQTPRPMARDHVRLILETMADHSRTLVDLLLVLDTLEWPTRPTPSLNPHVHILTAESVLPLSVAFLARWTTCHLQGWRMVAGGLLPIRMPPPPPPPVDLCHGGHMVAKYPLLHDPPPVGPPE